MTNFTDFKGEGKNLGLGLNTKTNINNNGSSINKTIGSKFDNLLLNTKSNLENKLGSNPNSLLSISYFNF
jgi:hypothetical protein